MYGGICDRSSVPKEAEREWLEGDQRVGWSIYCDAGGSMERVWYGQEIGESSGYRSLKMYCYKGSELI